MPEVLIARQLQRWTALSGCGLLAVTWRLWTPQAVFPQVPLLAWLCNAPVWIDWACLTWLSAALVCLAISPSLQEPRQLRLECFGFLSIFVTLLVLVALDQHRLQPWAYELWILAVIWLGFREPLDRMRWMRRILISVYFYSACGKFDFEFLHTVGQQMLTTLAGFLQFDATQFSEPLRLAVVATFPLFELAIAFGLLFPQTRRLAGILAILLHLGLILTLGPLGLNNRPGVLVWNVQVALQVYWLFVARESPAQDGQPASRLVLSARNLREWFCTATMALMMLLPLTERFGFWDHWTSWALYAPHSSRIRIEVAPPAIDRLPVSLRELISPSEESTEEYAAWIRLPIDTWSLQTLDSPIYPQARYQLGVAEYLAEVIDSEFQIRATLLGPASRFTGQRDHIELDGRSAIFNEAKHFWLNTHCRNITGRLSRD